jgi:hypothetical protein
MPGGEMPCGRPRRRVLELFAAVQWARMLDQHE